MCGLNFSYEKTFNFSEAKLPEKIDTGVFEFNFKENEGYQNDYIESIEDIIMDAQEQLPEGVVITLYVQDCEPGNNDFYLLFDKNNYLWIDVNDIVIRYDTPKAQKDENLQKAAMEILKEMRKSFEEKIKSINNILQGE